MANEQCTLLGGAFAICIQLLLAITAIITLLYKRHIEVPPNRRPWLVWFFDCSKQAYASALQHLVNLLFGVIFAENSVASECAWYLVNFTITVACGLFILHFAMKGYEYVVERYNLVLLRSGEYGDPPSWKPWIWQMLIWGFIASAEKFVTVVVVIWPLRKVLDNFAAAIEKPVEDNPRVELAIVMVLAPVLLNMLFYWIVDNIIKRRDKVNMREISQDTYDVYDSDLEAREKDEVSVVIVPNEEGRRKSYATMV